MIKKIILIAFSTLLLFGCKNKEKKTSEKELKTHASGRDALSYIQLINQQKSQAFDSFIEQLSLEEKISQLFIENINGNTIYQPVENLSEITSSNTTNKKIVPGGYLFFGFNLADNTEEIMTFTDSIKSYCNENNQIIPFLAVDQEGGFVNRLRSYSGPLPSQQRVAQCLTTEQTYRLYELQAQQMKLLGFNMNLAPVIEICTDDNKDFLNQRSFGDKATVIKYGKECVLAYENNYVSTVLKHFPGNTNTDPHSGLPEIILTKDELFESVEPFKKIIEENPAGILMSHARTTAIDEQTPACLSYTWVTEILRNQFNYKGIIFSDDIFMAALAKNGYPPETAVVKAIEAGIDCIMISEKRIAKPASVLYEKASGDKTFEEKINEAVKRIITYKLNNGLLELVDNSNGTYSINVVLTEKDYFNTIDQRMIDFNKAKNENIEIYQKYFQ